MAARVNGYLGRVLWRGAAEVPALPGAGERSEPTPAEAAPIPPTVKRGEHQEPERFELVLADGQIKIIEKRQGQNGKVGFIDWLNVTFHETTAHLLQWGCQITDEGVIQAVSAKLAEIFGFGITSQCDRGRNFYQRAYVLGDDYGFVCHGGQRDSVLVMVSGHGLAGAAEGWEVRLHDFLTNLAVKPKLTRVDVAHDCFEGEYTVDQASDEWDAGLFQLPKSPTNPDCEQRGNWKRPNGKGRSFYVGHRTSGKFLRVYEKGKQLGAPSSLWVRIECEYKSADRVIPFDILLNPGCYLAGAYPALEFINDEVSRIRTIRETKVVEKAKKEDWINRVAGADLHVLHELEPGADAAEKALNLINRLKNESKLPKWAVLADYRMVGRQIHEVLTTAAEGVPAGISVIADAFERECL